MRIAVINDTHAGVRNASDIFADNANAFYRDVFFPYLLENDIKRIVHLGDFYDNRKAVAVKTMHRARHDFLHKLREYGIHMDIIPGNHDIVYKNSNEINSLKELMGHFMGEVTLHMEPVVLDFDGFKLGLIPWICAENKKQVLSFMKKCKADWLGGHFEIKGFDLLRGVKAQHGMETDSFSRFEQVISGHFHTKSSAGNIMYLGSQMEFTWSDANDPKFFHVIDTEKRNIEAISNPITLFERIYYDVKDKTAETYDVEQCDNKFVKIVVINKGDDLFKFDKFVDKIQARPIHELKIQENFDEFVGKNVNDENLRMENTETLLDDYVDNLDTTLDRNRLKHSMRNLLIEAQSMEFAQ